MTQLLQKSESKCYVCLRITPEYVLKTAHKVWEEDPETARKIGLKASEIVEQGYRRNPIFFCGSSAKRVLGGLFYLLGFQYEAPKTIAEVNSVMACSYVTIKSGYREWLKKFPDFFLEFKLESYHYDRYSVDGDSLDVDYLTFQGKRVTVLTARIHDFVEKVFGENE